MLQGGSFGINSFSINFDELSVSFLCFVFDFNDHYGRVISSIFMISPSIQKRPRGICAELRWDYAMAVADPYKEYFYLRRSLYRFNISAISELSAFKLEFWLSLIWLNPAYNNYIVFLFLRVELCYLYAVFRGFSFLDYLHAVWATGNVVEVLERRLFWKRLRPYLEDFSLLIEKPDPYAIPTWLIVCIVEESFAFGVMVLNRYQWDLYYLNCIRNMELLKKDKNHIWIPPTKWQLPLVEFRLSRKQKLELYLHKVDHNHLVWRWRYERLHLILAKEYSRRVGVLWDRFHIKMLFYAR